MTSTLPSASRPVAVNAPIEHALPHAVDSLRAVLRQLAQVVARMTLEQYRTKPVGVVSSSIGEQVRHCLDHVDALCASAGGGPLTYDRRKRGTEIEENLQAALAAIDRQDRALSIIRHDCKPRPLCLTALVSEATPPVMVETTLERELIFVLSHTIHHNALIGVMARTLGVSVPDDFGYAPSTLAQTAERGLEPLTTVPCQSPATEAQVC